MPIATLISDLGNNDYQIPAVKGALLAANPNLNVVDITHNIKPFHFVDAAYILTNCFRDFPDGTFHLIGIEGDFSKKKEWIVAKLENHFFFTKNTGILSIISDKKPEWCFKIDTAKRDLKFPFKNILAKAAGKMIQGLKPNEIGQPFTDLVNRSLLQPTVSSYGINGTIVFITPYENAITNIHRKHFTNFKKFKLCLIHYNKTEYFDRIFNSYHDLPEGVAGCFFGENGFLELGIHGGDSKNLLDFIKGKQIWIEFK
ncbi:MAG: SAM hydrolase/SAM-dependent halogenase family protein [Bacteroidia bacterium]